MALNADDVRLRIPLSPEATERLKDRPILRNRAMKARPAILAPVAPLNCGTTQTRFKFKIWDDVNRSVETWIRQAIQDWNDLLGKEVLVEAGHAEPLIDLAIGTKPFGFGWPNFESAPIGALLPHNSKGYDEPQDEYGECILYWDDRFVRRIGQINIADDLGKRDTKCAFSHELGHFFLLGHLSEPYRLMHHSLNGVYLPFPREMEWIREINRFEW